MREGDREKETKTGRKERMQRGERHWLTARVDSILSFRESRALTLRDQRGQHCHEHHVQSAVYDLLRNAVILIVI